MKKDKEKVSTKEIEKIDEDNFSFQKTGSLEEDLELFNKITKIEIEEEEVQNIELQEIVIKETGNYLNLKENSINIPVEMIVFPFFTPQKQKKKVQFKYVFEDLGVTMYSIITPRGKDDVVFQPSIFEEKIYLFLISMYQSMNEIHKKNNSDDEEIAIEFEISDFIVKFLGNKMNRAYYAKVEQALKNLKNTQYQFEISNHTKFGENKFEDKEFKLLTYQKLRNGKKIYYKVFLNNNIIKKIKQKRYIKYNTKTLVELMGEDPIASRIYRYISKERYKSSTGSINIRTLAAIIPLKIEQITKRETKSGTKKYILNRTKPVLNRILKAFGVLLKLDYIKNFEEEYDRKEDTYYINYMFNKERDGDCHFSEYVNKKDKKIKREISEDFFEEEILDTDIDINSVENIDYLINKLKNINKYKVCWNKRVDNKFDKILKEEGEVKLKRLLNLLIIDDSKIEKSLVKTINDILKNLRNKKNTLNNNLNLFGNVVKEKGIKSKSQINKARRRKMKGFEEIENIKKENKREKTKEVEEAEIVIENKAKKEIKKEVKKEIKKEVKKENKVETKAKTIENILQNFDELTQIEIEKKALELLEKEDGDIETIKNYKKISKTIYYNIMVSYIEKIIKEEY